MGGGTLGGDAFNFCIKVVDNVIYLFGVQGT